MDVPAVKVCRICQLEKPASEFYPAPKNKDGLYNYCKECERNRVNSHPTRKTRGAAHYEMNKDKLLAQHKVWREQNPERTKELQRQWQKENSDYANERKKEYNRKNPEKLKRYRATSNAKPSTKESRRQWRSENRDKARIWEASRRARKKSATIVPFTKDQLMDRWAYYGDKCWICGDPATETDHVKPLSKGGAHALCNLRPICKPCNSQKGALWPFTPSLIERIAA